MDTTTLDSYSKRAYEVIMAARPDLSPFMSACPDNDTLESYLLIRIPSPHVQGREINLYTADDEVTICIDMYEWHFSALTDPSGTEAESALGLCERILGDRVMVASFWSGDTWVGSTLVDAGEGVELPSTFRQDATNVRIASWSGSQDIAYAL